MLRKASSSLQRGRKNAGQAYVNIQTSCFVSRRNSIALNLQYRLVNLRNCLFCTITQTLFIKVNFFYFLSCYASLVIVPTLPDFSRHRVGHKQYQSKYHHDRHFGPFFEDPLNTSGTLQVGFHQGTESILNCRVGMLKDKTVITSICFPVSEKLNWTIYLSTRLCG